MSLAKAARRRGLDCSGEMGGEGREVIQTATVAGSEEVRVKAGRVQTSTC